MPRYPLTLFVSVEAKPGDQLAFDPGDEEDFKGYFQTFGVTARNEKELLEIIKGYLDADLGSTLVEISERWEPEFEGVDADLRGDVGDLDRVGIWYRSGRAWYGPEEEDDEEEESRTVN